LLHAPAATLLTQNPQKGRPQILSLVGVPADMANSIDPQQLPDRPDWQWQPQPDLFGSHALDQHVVVEMDDQRQTHLRFGNDELGKHPDAGTHFFVTYRVGNGIAGNLGAETLTHVVLRQTLDLGTTLQPHNPLPARGGTAPEPLSDVKLYAPHRFRKDLQRAITAQDYADLVMRDFADQVQQAGASLRWTGSGYEAAVAVDPLGSETVSESLLQDIRDRLYRYRRMGHDLVVQPAVYVPLEIAMVVCVHPDYLRGHVKAALLDAFSDRLLPNGHRGFFHPDNLTFGTSIALSQLVATAAAVTGVENVVVTQLQRMDEGSNGELMQGVLPIHPLEIARLSNNPNFPENGKLTLDLRGGR
jgi:predicted phage baseplate assembly protein